MELELFRLIPPMMKFANPPRFDFELAAIVVPTAEAAFFDKGFMRMDFSCARPVSVRYTPSSNFEAFGVGS